MPYPSQGGSVRLIEIKGARRNLLLFEVSTVPRHEYSADRILQNPCAQLVRTTAQRYLRDIRNAGKRVTGRRPTWKRRAREFRAHALDAHRPHRRARRRRRDGDDEG